MARRIVAPGNDLRGPEFRGLFFVKRGCPALSLRQTEVETTAQHSTPFADGKAASRKLGQNYYLSKHA